MLVPAVAVIVRVIAFLYMGYFNNDNHLEVIKYVADNWRPARADQFNHAYNPPCYYFLEALSFTKATCQPSIFCRSAYPSPRWC